MQKLMNKNQTTDIIYNIPTKPLSIPHTHNVQIDNVPTNRNSITLYTEPSFRAIVDRTDADILNYESDGQSCTFDVGTHTVTITGRNQDFFNKMNECADKFKARLGEPR